MFKSQLNWTIHEREHGSQQCRMRSLNIHPRLSAQVTENSRGGGYGATCKYQLHIIKQERNVMCE
jgi:hypothetical protein